MLCVVTKSHEHFIPELGQISHSLRKYGHADTEVVFTDNPRADRAALELAIPALLKDVEPVPKSSLDRLELPDDWAISILTSTHQVNLRLNNLLENLSSPRFQNSNLPIAFDMEWPVDKTTGIQGRVALVSIGFDKEIILIQVSFLFPSL